MRTPSYSQRIKTDIINTPVTTKHCAAAELDALFLVHTAARVSAAITQRRDKLLTIAGSPAFSDAYEPKRLCCKRAFLRGAFLVCGTMSDPAKSYHLEFVLHDESKTALLLKVLNAFELDAKVTHRKNNSVVYIKESEKIVDMLNIIGAHKILLELENLRIIKEMRGNVNRQVNCETANITKTVNACARQLDAIRRLEHTAGLSSLPPHLEEIARIRLNQPDISLSELGRLCTPPLGKSGVNHRLNKIIEIADR